MGMLADLGDEDIAPTVVGEGKRLVDWWRDVADDEDRVLLRRWVETKVPHRVIADRLNASGFKIGRHTVEHGIRRLRSIEWAT